MQYAFSNHFVSSIQQMIVCRDLHSLPSFEKSVLTIGSFDGVHQGHRKLLSKIREIADAESLISIVITFDPHPRQVVVPKHKTFKLLQTLEEKLEVMEESDIDYVVIVPFTQAFSQITPQDYIEEFLVKKFNPAHIAIGYDHKFGLNRAGNIHLLREYGLSFDFKVTEIPVHMLNDIAISSTKIRDALQAGEIDTANSFLESSFPITGKVVKGQQLGRELGYPTANIAVENEFKLIPAYGVYAVTVKVDEQDHNGMLYIGTKPTIDGTEQEVIEVNIFDFDRDLYEQEIRVYLQAYIRDDIKFDSLDSLQAQIAADEKQIRVILSILEENKRAEVAIVVLNYNGEEYLESFLPFMTDSYSNGSSKIFVIDNDSTDGSVEYIREWHPEVTIIQLDKNYGFAEGYNRGLAQIDADYFVVVNSDLQVTDNWLDPIIKLMKADETIAAVQPKVLSLEHKDSFEYAGAAGGLMDVLNYPFCRGRIFESVEKDEQQYEDVTDIFWASGAAMVIQSKLMKSFGGFDADFFAHQEEIDLCWRLKNAGYRICYMPHSKVYHLGGGTLSYDNPRKTYLNFRNNSISVFKNESFGKLFWKVPVRLALDLVSTFKFLFSGQTAAAKAVIKAWGYIVSHPLVINKKRKDTLHVLKSHKIGAPTSDGRYSKSIVWSYFILGKKTFKSL